MTKSVQEIMKVFSLLVFFCLLLCAPAGTLRADMNILDLAEMGKGRIEWSFFGGQGILILGRERYTFSLPTGWIIHNYREKIPGRVYRGDGGGVFVTGPAEAKILDSISSAASAAPVVAAILLDPGHGGRDPGAIGSHSIDGKKIEVLEKNIVFQVCTDVFRKLKETYPDKRVMLTRTDDSYPSLEERVDMANSVDLADNEAVIFISVHANASLNSKAKGFEVWYLPPDYRRTLIDQNSVDTHPEEIIPILNSMLEEEYTTESILLAQQVLKGLNREVGDLTENRGLKEEIWFVVRKAKMPSILVELGFVTNEAEALSLNDPEYLRKLSEAIYNGTSRFITNFESTKGFTE